MADKKITFLDETPTIVESDLIPVVQGAGTTPVTKKMTKQNFMSTIGLPSGWLLDISNVWGYASASTFTVNGDYTNIYKKGMRVKWTQTTVKYGIVAIDSTFGAGVTTVTIVVNTDYVITNAAISDNYYSYNSSPLGFPNWFNYSATWNNVTTTSATIVNRYSITDGICYFINTFTLGASSAVTGDVNFTLPVNMVNAGISQAALIDTGIVGNLGTASLTSTNCYVRVTNVAATYPTIDNVLSATIPFTWATGDVIRASGWYEW